jgi:hypothetical protein
VAPRVPSVSPFSRVLAVPIVLLGSAAAIALPNGYTCGEGTVLEVHRQWSFGQERWFHIVGAAGGALLGLLVFRRYRRLGPHVAMTTARDSS